MHYTRPVISFLLILMGFSAVAQRYDVRVYGVRNGLPHLSITSLGLDERGQLLIGTAGGGIARFDGQLFDVASTAQGLPSGHISSAATTQNQVTWVATDLGLAVDSSGSIRQFSTVSNTPKATFYQLTRHQNGLWAATSNGIFALGRQSQTTITKSEGLPSNDVRTLLSTHDSLWAGTYGGGLALVGPTGEITSFGTEKGLTDAFVTALHRSPQGKIFIGTADGVFEQKNGRFEQVRHTAGTRANALASEANGTLWIATAEGILIVGPNGPLRISERNGIPSNNVRDLLIDREGTAWLATDKGLASIANLAQNHYMTRSGSAFEASSFLLQPDGSIWASGRNGGVFSFNGLSFDPALTDQEVMGHPITCLAFGPNKSLWAGTSDFSGIISLKEGKAVYITDEPGLADNNITAMLNAPDGHIYIGTPNGLSKFDGQQFVRLVGIEGAITALAAGVGGRILVADDAGNLKTIDDNGTTLTAQFPCAITALLVLPDGRVVVGTASAGIAIIHKKSNTQWGPAQGLSSASIRSLAWDGAHLWAGTARGIDRVDLGGGKVFRLTPSGGFQAGECLPGAMLNEAERLWVGTPLGITAIQKSELRPLPGAPEVFIQSVQLFLENLVALDRANEHIELGHDQNHLRFSFKAVSLARAQYVSYLYKLDGYEREWNESVNGLANYPALPPGTYTFRVMACMADADCNGTEATFMFVIRPPFWQTVWFYAVLVVALAITFVAVVRWREQQLLARNRELEQKVNERTRQLKEQRDLVEEKNRHIQEGIDYARNIQFAILPSEDELSRIFNGHFVVYRPKETVGGDFYWAHADAQHRWLAVADCTGHGVAGAFMTMIGTDLLNQIIIEQKITSPAQVLHELDRGIKLAFAQSDRQFETEQGMDMTLIRFDAISNTAVVASAMRGLLIVDNGVLKEIEGDLCPITSRTDATPRFTDKAIELVQGSMVYLSSDGLCDQFGGPKGKKFGSVQLRQLLTDMFGQSLQDQKLRLIQTFDQWKGTEPQQDDILLIGLRI